ncbi:uncharacterized protein LOC113360323 [Papaver somniferum]|uniref:uncharacterized protein LOC113360323 n=1 Tax=Papaver somniferum TaxID=3469 RepID=UPI000E70074D|nr:uncharacterized protein LOC113360323 [Papaver somniferum]
MIYSSDLFVNCGSDFDALSNPDVGDCNGNEFVLEPTLLVSLPLRPVVTDDEFEKEINLMLVDYVDSMDVEHAPANDHGGIAENSLVRDFIRSKMVELRLNEVFSFGNPFTWCNRRFKNPAELIFEKLDRGFMNDKWVSVLPETQVTSLGRVYSDHCPVFLKPFHQEQKFYIPYKIFKCWQLSPDFKNVLVKSWSKRVKGSSRFTVAGKLKNVKQDLCFWNVNSFGHIKNTIHKLNSEIEKLQSLPYSPAIGTFILNYSQQLDYWYGIANSFYKQKARINYFIQYDKNTHFFHNVVKLRNMYNTIHIVRNDQGNWLDCREQVVSLFESHFKKVFSSSKPCDADIHDVLKDIHPIITDEINLSLVAIPTVDEIYSTVKVMEPWNSPGPDGFPAGFFRDNWDIVSGQCPLASHIWFDLSLQHLVSYDYHWIDDYFLSWFDSRLGQSPFAVDWPSIGAIFCGVFGS